MSASSHSEKLDKLVFYSDPHIGLSRVANTTRESSILWQRLCTASAQQAITQGRGKEKALVFCLGDLFDAFHNPEEVLLQGLNLLKNTDYCMEGNHDISNYVGAVGSLGFLSDLHNGAHCIASPKLSAPYFDMLPPMNVRGTTVEVTAIPHTLTQELFLESIQMAGDAVGKSEEEGKKKILLLHCNVLLPDEFINESTLNLDPKAVTQALRHFDYILCGHEHDPKDLSGGRVKVLGTTFPTSKSDTLTDKRILTFDGDSFESVRVWNSKDSTKTYSIDNLPDKTDAQFVTVTGQAPSGDAMSITKTISKFKERSPDLLALFMEVEFGSQAQLSNGDHSARPENLMEKIDKSLSGHELEPMWKEAKEGVA